MFIKSTPTKDFTPANSQLGLVIAIAIIICWFITLIGFLILDLSPIPLTLIVLGILFRSFIHTGLFITTHEAIHGLVSRDRQINQAIGHLTSLLYALLPYRVLRRNHRLHHRYPATKKDPDFYFSNNFLLWYASFMKEYQKGRQAWVLVIGMAAIFAVLVSFQIAPINIFLFWVIPLILSSLQLFTFGIFLPHRQEEDYSIHSSHSQAEDNQAKTIDYSEFWSFITCYHFGYHWEHHQYPNLPWYKLPLARHQHKSLLKKCQL